VLVQGTVCNALVYSTAGKVTDSVQRTTTAMLTLLTLVMSCRSGSADDCSTRHVTAILYDVVCAYAITKLCLTLWYDVHVFTRVYAVLCCTNRSVVSSYRGRQMQQYMTTAMMRPCENTLDRYVYIACMHVDTAHCVVYVACASHITLCMRAYCRQCFRCTI
jgi:hypothetical protein